MDNKPSRIYWFSGTGNSLFAAKCLAKGLNGEITLIPIANGVPSGAVGGKGEKVGFVFPSYYGNLPRMVRSFAEKIQIVPETYIFAIVTMGALGQGSVTALRSVLREKGLRLDYGRGINMPACYVIKYDPADKNKCLGRLDKTNRLMGRIASDIAAGARSVKGLKFAANNLYKDIASLDTEFFAEDTCDACGQCARICPAGNIIMEGGKPLWQHRCEHCIACISWCPLQAIQYGSRTKARRRYQNPRIKVEELFFKQ
ncbi:MAG: EFR1 family ferrodoxin [Clostridiales bacterium]|nr:EFR1 family ferrodoxin [Clostridiales bacterium]